MCALLPIAGSSGASEDGNALGPNGERVAVKPGADFHITGVCVVCVNVRVFVFVCMHVPVCVLMCCKRVSN